MPINDYSDHDGLGLAALVAKGEVTPLELVDAAIERIERHNPALNAVVYKAYDEARDRARGPLPDGPFKGVPFLIKDLGMPVAGWPRSYGSKFAASVVDAADGELTGRYRAAGVIPLGKTNTPEYGITGTTEGAHLGEDALVGRLVGVGVDDARVRCQLGGGATHGDASRFHDIGRVRVAERFAGVLLGEKNSHPLAVEPHQHLEQRCDDQRCQTERNLVGEQQGRLAHHGWCMAVLLQVAEAVRAM